MPFEPSEGSQVKLYIDFEVSLRSHLGWKAPWRSGTAAHGAGTGPSTMYLAWDGFLFICLFFVCRM